ncbi:hypothetical protein 2011_scaffold3_00067 [Bacteriophage sp.]|nr:hypothetical protein 2011_scaffold3_00067 [Bacteriophage sp.]
MNCQILCVVHKSFESHHRHNCVKAIVFACHSVSSYSSITVNSLLLVVLVAINCNPFFLHFS